MLRSYSQKGVVVPEFAAFICEAREARLGAAQRQSACLAREAWVHSSTTKDVTRTAAKALVENACSKSRVPEPSE